MIIIITEEQLIRAIRMMKAIENKTAGMESDVFDVMGRCLN